MHTAKASQTPEQHLGSGSEKFSSLHLTEGTQMCVWRGWGGKSECAQQYLNTELPEHWTHIRWQGQASRQVLNQWCQVYIT